jgi:hypothetical protein
LPPVPRRVGIRSVHAAINENPGFEQKTLIAPNLWSVSSTNCCTSASCVTSILTAKPPNLGCQRLRALPVDVRDDYHLGTLSREPPGESCANAMSCAGDHNHFAANNHESPSYRAGDIFVLENAPQYPR